MPLSGDGKLGFCEIFAPIGKGGMCEAWMARDTRLDRNAALRVSKQELTRLGRGDRYRGSAESSQHLPAYDSGPNYLVMEHIEGDSRHLFAGLCRTL